MATNIKIKNLSEGYQSIITNGKHAIVGDEPISSKGAPSKLKTNIKVKISIEGDISNDMLNELLKQADSCFIRRQIFGEWNIEHAQSLETVSV